MADSLKQILDKSQVGTPSTSIAPWKAGDIAVHDGQSISPQSTITAAQLTGATAGGHLTGTYPNPSIASSTVTSAMIVDGTIVDGDIAAAAAISCSKVNTRRITSSTNSSSVTITASTAASATTVITLPSATYSGGLVRFEFSAPLAYYLTTVATTSLSINLWDNTAGSDLGVLANVVCGVAGAYSEIPLNCYMELTPSAGARVYSIRAWKAAAADTGVIVAGSGGSGTRIPMSFSATYV